MLPEPVQHPTSDRFRDFSGEIYGKLTVKYYIGKAKNGLDFKWLCQCSCGNYKAVNTGNMCRTTDCLKCKRIKILDENLNPILERPKNMICIKCNKEYPFTPEFFIRHKDYYFGLKHTRCKECIKKYQRPDATKRRFNLKCEVLYHYSNGDIKCECCESRIIEGLTLDHIHGAGIKNRRLQKNRSKFYYNLKKQGYPPGLRVLCMGCNASMYIHKGYCEHKNPEKFITVEELIKKWS